MQLEDVVTEGRIGVVYIGLQNIQSLTNRKRTRYLPIRTAPALSATVAMLQACLIVSTFDPTDVPKELDTSLAPRPQANIKDTRKPKTTIHTTSVEYGSSMLEVSTSLCSQLKRLADTLKFLGHAFTKNVTETIVINVTGLYLCFGTGHWKTKKMCKIRNCMMVTNHFVVFWLMALCSLVGV